MKQFLTRFVLVALAFAPCISRAGEFSVSPIRLTLSGASRSQLLGITNVGNAPARFLVRSANWTVNEAGAVELSSDDSLVVFPASFTVAPKATQNIRAGTDQAAGDVEQTWRIVLEELPDPNAASNGSTTINVLSVLSVPVFMPPVTTRKSLQASLQSVSGPNAKVLLSNNGNAHELVASLSIAALRGTQTAAQAQQEGWYMLPGKSRVFSFSTDKAWCAPDVSSFSLRAIDRDGQVLVEQSVNAREACR